MPSSELGKRLVIVIEWKLYANKFSAALSTVIAGRDELIFKVWELLTVTGISEAFLGGGGGSH